MKYRKKPVVVEAFRFGVDRMPLWFTDKIDTKEVKIELGYAIIDTLEGKMKAEFLDYIIKGVKGELYPCKDDIFEATYEKVEE